VESFPILFLRYANGLEYSHWANRQSEISRSGHERRSP